MSYITLYIQLSKLDTLRLAMSYIAFYIQLSKLDTLRLAMSYIAHLKRTLEDPDDQEQGCKPTVSR